MPLPKASQMVAAIAALTSSGCAAHLPRADEHVAFLERSTVSLSTDRSEAFEVQPAVHVLLWNGLDAPGVAEDGGYAATLSASLLGTLRMWRDASTPVRTPTYEPRLKLQLFRAAALGERGDATLPDPRHHGLAALELAVGHRSNGEEGCALADHVRVGDRNDFDCAPTTDPPSTALNVRDGSFTTNYAAAGAVLRWMAPAGAHPGGSWVATVGGGAEWNLPCHFGACMPAEMRERYGAVRATWTAEAEAPLSAVVPLPEPARPLRIRAGASGGVRLDGTRGPLADAAFEVAVIGQHRPGGMEAGLFVQRHVGSDYLNIHFEQRLDAWILGVVIDPAPASAMAR